MATLVHDDQIDAAPLRRGRPTVWRSRGPLVSTASGDYLFARAFSELVTTGDMQAVTVLSDACLALARGEILQREQAGNADTTPGAVPGALPAEDRAAVRGRATLGARLGGLPVDETERMGEFGTRSGSRSRSPTTSWTATATRTRPARRSAPTFSTAPSRCRFCSPRGATPRSRSVLRRGAGSGRRAADAGPRRPLRRGADARPRPSGTRRRARRARRARRPRRRRRARRRGARRGRAARVARPRGQTPAHFGAWIGARSLTRVAGSTHANPWGRPRMGPGPGGSTRVTVRQRVPRAGRFPATPRPRPATAAARARGGRAQAGPGAREPAALANVLADRIDEERVPAQERRPPRTRGCRSRAPRGSGSAAGSVPTASAGTRAAAGRATRPCRRSRARASRASAGSRSRSTQPSAPMNGLDGGPQLGVGRLCPARPVHQRVGLEMRERRGARERAARWSSCPTR